MSESPWWSRTPKIALHCSQWIPDTGTEHARNESSTMHCIAGKSAPSALSVRAKPNPNVPPSPKAFLQSWDSTLCNQDGYGGKNLPLAKSLPSLYLGPYWNGIKKRGILQPSSEQWDWGNPSRSIKEHPGVGCWGCSGRFLMISARALLKHEASSWPGVWRQVFPSVPGKEAGSFIGSRHSFHSCLCQLWIRLFFWRTSLINWKLINPLHVSGFSLEQCSNTRAVLHLEFWHLKL